MMPNPRLEDDNNTPFELINSSEAEPTQLSPAIKKEVEVIVIQTVHKVIVPTLTDTIRRAVKEAIESALATILSSTTWNSRNEIHPSESRSLQLHFLNKPSRTVVTGKQIEGEKSTSIKVALFDAKSGEIVKHGHESSAKVEIVFLEGDFNNVEGHDWTIEEFIQKIVTEREEKTSLLKGDAFLNLKDGVGTIGNIWFTNISNHMKNSKFRLGARVMNNSNGTRVREAISESFTVKDRRNSRKHYPPSLSDAVWRLNNIGKNGPLHKRLSKEKITTVRDFLTLYNLNRQRLIDIFVEETKSVGTKSVGVTINHAQTCKLDKTVYLYCPSSQQKNGVVFNVVGELKGLLWECQYVRIDTPSETEKAGVHNLVISAFKHWEEVVSFEDEASLMDYSSHLSNDHCHDFGLELQADLPSAVNEAVAADKAQRRSQRRWAMLFCILRWYSIWRIVAGKIVLMGSMGSLNDFGLHNIDNMDLSYDQPLSSPVQITNSLTYDMGSISQAFCEDEHMQYFNDDP